MMVVQKMKKMSSFLAGKSESFLIGSIFYPKNNRVGGALHIMMLMSEAFGTTN